MRHTCPIPNLLQVVNCAGAFAGPLAALCGPGVADVPVRARKRSVFSVHCDAGPAGGSPGEATTGLVVCPETGAYFRPEVG